MTAAAAQSAAPTPPVTLSVNGQVFDGFVAGLVQLTMTEAANSFDLTYAAENRVIETGDEVTLSIGAEALINGFVDTCSDTDEADQVTFRIAGRSKAQDVVDCSAVLKPGRWTNATVAKIASDLCAPFGVTVRVESPGDPFKSFSIQKGETALDTLSRLALRRGLYIYSIGGDLVLARAGSDQTATVLERGKNVIRWTRDSSWYARYSEYIFRAQARATDNNWGKGPNQLNHTVTDAEINRFRPLLVQAEAHDGLDLRTRAELERNQRAGRGETLTVLVDEWQTDEGTAWRPNVLVRARNARLAVDTDVLITTVRYRFGPNEPRQAELELMRPEAFDVGKYPALSRGEALK
jgi:prophage tail gpP-like protein